MKGDDRCLYGIGRAVVVLGVMGLIVQSNSFCLCSTPAQAERGCVLTSCPNV